MSRQDSLRSDLDRLARRGAKHLRRWELKKTVEATWPFLWQFALFLPLLVLAANLLGQLGVGPGWSLGAGATLVLAVLVPFLAFGLKLAFSMGAHRVDRRMALTLFDRELGLKDRLQTADEFIGSSSEGGFEQAAIEDAASHIQAALDVQLPPAEIAGPSLKTGRWHLGLLSLLVLIVGLWLGDQSFRFGADAINEDVPLVTAAEVDPFEPETEEEKQQREELEKDELERLNKAPRLARNERQEDADSGKMDAQLNPSTARMSSGKPGSRPQEAKKSQSSSSESGASGKSQESEKKEESGLKKPKKNKKKEDKESKEDEEKPSSGVSGGKGGSSGSKSSASDQKGAENKAAQEQEEDQSEGDPEDEEDEEQKAGSSSKPLLNQKKAPVNRSLSPSGLGEGQENPQANGRSGPGGLKKTRGVAAMLLGTPLPDRLNGQPNPGRVKVQREKAQPEEQFPDPALAQQRPPRDEAIGTLAHPEMLPWMRELVRNYFLASQQAATDVTPADEAGGDASNPTTGN